MTQPTDNVGVSVPEEPPTPAGTGLDPVVDPQGTYGPTNSGLIGQIPFSGWTSTLAQGSSTAGSTTGTVAYNGITQHDSRFAHLFRTPGGRRLKRLMKTLNGVIPGSLAQESRARVQHQQGAPGGLQIVEQTYYVNRNTTMADVQMITALLDRTVFTAYPTDVSGNGGGGKLNYKGIG